MCCTRTSLSGRKLHLGSPQHLVAEVPAELLRRAQVNLAPSEQSREFCLEFREAEEARRPARLELDQQVDVALGTIRSPQHRPEQGQAANAVRPTQPLQSR